MLNVGMIIAGAVLAIYLIFGPLVLLGIYVFFDRMAEKGETINPVRKNVSAEDKNPELWSAGDVRQHLKRKRRIQAADPDKLF